MIELTFTPIRADLTAAHRLSVLNRFFRRAAWKLWFFIILTAIFIAGAASYINTHKWEAFQRVFLRELPTGIMLFVGLYLLVIVLLYVCAPLLARRSLRTSKTLTEPYTVRIDEQGMRVQGPSISSEMKWNAFIGWSGNAQVLLLYRDATMFQFIPKRAFATPADIDRLHGWLISAGLPRIAPLR